MDELGHLLIEVRQMPAGKTVTWKQLEQVIESALRGKISSDALDQAVASQSREVMPT